MSEESSVIFVRNGKYLNERYKWGPIPYLFELWRFWVVLGMMMNSTEKPTGYAMVSGKSIDLDRLKVVRL